MWPRAVISTSKLPLAFERIRHRNTFSGWLKTLGALWFLWHGNKLLIRGHIVRLASPFILRSLVNVSHRLFSCKEVFKTFFFSWNHFFAIAGEVTKLQNHLTLLREEYVKLQNRLAEVEKKYQIATATAGQVGEDNFVARLLRTISELFDKELYRYRAHHLMSFCLWFPCDKFLYFDNNCASIICFP